MVRLLEQLAPFCRVYIPDLPGFGDSDKPTYALTIAELTDALVTWLDAADLSRAALLGNSLGCQLAVDAAVRYPERVARLVLQGPIVNSAARTLWRQVFRLLRNAPLEPPSHALNMLVDYRKCGLHARCAPFATRSRPTFRGSKPPRSWSGDQKTPSRRNAGQRRSRASCRTENLRSCRAALTR